MASGSIPRLLLAQLLGMKKNRHLTAHFTYIIQSSENTPNTFPIRTAFLSLSDQIFVDAIVHEYL
ncbi:uncharacterized protein ASCRUDRAFT_74248 [Ascoidea rubescens DSM 1968]|uniref:Uncharacterized protein n=1 Tax=Ascoidea rubescens DSM 1968 TaxID=1344418 RepID=A0A1D2VMD2_9ASCO|nr:hypothetical protein ASCRUDRAFT_74248 [Ascoidea rubescens DSM 1968]ODV62778.1 hypothetical protein ASCRUDRAFT_74248 [Ascoidea rubescens DSM 1968]